MGAESDQGTTHIAAIVFDFDYTLADSSPGVVICARHALAELGLPTATAEAIRATIGLSLEASLVALAGKEHAALGSDYRRAFIGKADHVMTDSTTLLPGAREAIETLHRAGVPLAIVTNKLRYRVLEVLRREDLAGTFGTIVGAGDVMGADGETVQKPNPAPLLMAIEVLGAPAKHALYVGDSPTDAETARRAGVRFVATLAGVTPPEAFDAYPVWRTVSIVGELPLLLGLS